MTYRADHTPPRRFRRLRHGSAGQLVPDEPDATPPPATPPPLPSPALSAAAARLTGDDPKGWIRTSRRAFALGLGSAGAACSRGEQSASVARLFPPDEDLFGVGRLFPPDEDLFGVDPAVRPGSFVPAPSPQPPCSWRSSARASKGRTASKPQRDKATQFAAGDRVHVYSSSQQRWFCDGVVLKVDSYIKVKYDSGASSKALPASSDLSDVLVRAPPPAPPATTAGSDATFAGEKPKQACGTWSGSRHRLSRGDSDSSCERVKREGFTCSAGSDKRKNRLAASSQDIGAYKVCANQEVPEGKSLAVADIVEGHKKQGIIQVSPVPERLHADTETRQEETSEALRQQEEELGLEKESIRKMLQEVKRRGAEFRARKEELRRQAQASIPDAPLLRKRARDSLPKGQGQSGSPTTKRNKSIAGLEDAEADALLNFSPGAYAPPFVIRRLVGEDPCAICLDPLHGQALTISICGHIFHKSCLDTAGSAACPHCRRPVDTDRPKVLRNLTREALRDLKVLVPPNYREIPFRQLSRMVNSPPLYIGGLSGSPFADQELIDAIGALSREHKGAVVIEKDLVICTW